MKTALIAGILMITSPFATSAYVDYGSWYQGPNANQQYYQPMYAFASYGRAQVTPTGSANQYPYQSWQQAPQFAQANYGYGYPSYQSYSYYPQNYGYGGYNYYPQNYGYNSYSQNYDYGGNSSLSSPIHPGYPTGEIMPWLGGELCTFPGYEGRAKCGSNPRQYVYDHWTGTWY